MVGKSADRGIELRVRLFRALEDPTAARGCIEGQQRALADFGVRHTTSSDLDHRDPDLHLVTAETASGERCGGLSILRQSPTNVLPVARALAHVEPELQRKLARRSRRGVAEICAGWVAREHRGRGLYATLLRAAIAVAPFLQIRYAVGMGYAKTLDLYQALGFLPDVSLGESGGFRYPDERYVSMVVWGDCVRLPFAAPDEKKAILKVRDALRRELRRPTFAVGAVAYELAWPPNLPQVRSA